MQAKHVCDYITKYNYIEGGSSLINQLQEDTLRLDNRTVASCVWIDSCCREFF